MMSAMLSSNSEESGVLSVTGAALPVDILTEIQ